MTLSPAHWRFLFLFGLTVFLYFAFLGVRDIWDIDEGMHAAMAQTMVLSGDWVTPVFNGEAFFDKPALFNWLNAIAFVVAGFTEVAARLPAAICGLGTVLLTWQLGRRLFDEPTGFLAGIVLATSLEFMVLSRVVQYDIPFTFFTTLTMFCLAMGILDANKRRRYFLAFYAAAALAVLTKGPIGALLPGIALGGWLLSERRWSLLREAMILPGLLLFFAIVTPWYAMMERANPGYLDYFIVKQHFGNFLGGDGTMKPRHPEPFYYYLPVLLAGLLPWSAALPQVLVHGWRADGQRVQGLSRFLVLWIALIFLFFSVATSKLSTYVLPLFPACALLIARYLTVVYRAPSDWNRRGMLIGLGCWLVPILLLSIYAIAEDPWTYWKHRTGIEWRDFEVFLVLFCALLAGSLALFYIRRPRAGITVMAATSPLLWFYVLLVIVPGVNPYKGSKEIGLQIDYLLNDGQPIPMYGQLLDSTFFYTGRNGRMLHSEEELYDYLDSPNRRYVLIRSRERTEEKTFKGDYHIIVRHGNKAVVSNRPSSLGPGP